MSKIKTLKELKQIAKKLKQINKKIVFTNGCFDLLHYGHIKYLGQCKQLGDVLVLGLNSDRSVKRLKGSLRPLVRQNERAKVLSALEAIDFVIIFNEPTPLKIIKELTPDVLAKGADWAKGDIVGRAHVEKSGGKVVTIPFVKGFSTTGLINKIRREKK